MILIAASMSLLAIIAGMFLLAKTQKENLSNLFKYVSYFVILVGFLNLFGGGALFMAKKCMKNCMNQSQSDCDKEDDCCKNKKSKKSCSKMEICEEEEEGMCEEGKEMCEEGGAEMCIEKGKVIKGEECEMGAKKDCCKDKMVKKDSVVFKK